LSTHFREAATTWSRYPLMPQFTVDVQRNQQAIYKSTLLHILQSSPLTINRWDESSLTEESQPGWSSLPARRREEPAQLKLLTYGREEDEGKKKGKMHLRWIYAQCGSPTKVMNTGYRSTPIRWWIPMTISDRFGWRSWMTPNTPSAEPKLYPILPCKRQSCFVPGDTRTPHFIYPDRRSHDRHLSMISFDLGQVSTLGQESTLHSLFLTHTEISSIQLVSAEHLRSMALCLKDRLANAFLIYILLQLVTSRCWWTVVRPQVGGWMARMNLRGWGTLILSVLLR